MAGKKLVLSVVLISLGIAGLVVACGGAADEPPAALSGEELLQARCTKCHTLDPVEVASKSQAEWENTVHRMIGKGAQLTDAEADTLVKYLAETYGP
jgi:mono/diheme cytochrome c family protein